jgi:hypothetical protein
MMDKVVDTLLFALSGLGGMGNGLVVEFVV